MQARRRAFIIRVWQSEDGQTHGQISDPEDGWRRPFASAAQLWWLLRLHTLATKADSTDNLREEKDG